MADERGRFWFKSSLFEIEPGEDKEVNPGIYGKQLAEWLAKKLQARGYKPEIIAEDWGRCLMCSRKPVWLWVGCANMQEPDSPGQTLPGKGDVIWHCFVECEVPFWKRMFRRVDTETLRDKLSADLFSMLSSDSGILFVPEP